MSSRKESLDSKDQFKDSSIPSLQHFRIGELLQNDTRFSILMFLKMNQRLSFGDIARLTGKSRSTIHHHLQKLIDCGLVQEVETAEPRDQFSPKHYELVPVSKSVYDFSTIPGLPLEKQVSAFLTTTKLHQHASHNLQQILSVFNRFLDSIESRIIDNIHNNVDPVDLHEMLADVTSPDDYSLKFNDIHFYSIKVSEQVYREYRKELDHFYKRLSDLVKNEKTQGEVVSEPFFIYHVSAPLGKQFLVEPANHGEEKKKIR